jgi:hypothetical protein
MSKKRRPHRRNAGRENVPTVPDTLFQPLVRRLDQLMEFHRRSWPDGINPEKSIHPLVKEIGPAARAYKSGVRAKSLYDKMEEIEAWLGAGVDMKTASPCPPPGEEEGS